VSELTGQLQVDGDALERVCGELRRRGRLAVRQGRLFRPDLAPEQNLTPQGRELAARLRAAGKSGLELKALTVPGAQKELRDLARAGLAVSLDGNLFLSPPIYRRLAAEVIGGQPPGDRFSVPQAKERTGLTRKYMLPLLNKMESEGLVRRVGDVRVILRVDPLLADPLQADAPREDTPRPPGRPPAPTGAG
jgi:selenocysteine-specific elongation factor